MVFATLKPTFRGQNWGQKKVNPMTSKGLTS